MEDRSVAAEAGEGRQTQELSAEMAVARAEYFAISKEIDTYCSLIHSRVHGMNAPDGSFRLEQLSKRHRLAFQKYQLALQSYTRTVLNVLPAGLAAGTAPAQIPAPQKPQITERELEVLTRLADGKTTKQIARELGIAFKTAMTHRTHLLQKFDANNVALLIRKAILHGFIEP